MGTFLLLFLLGWGFGAHASTGGDLRALSAPEPGDEAGDLIDGMPYETLEGMRLAGLESARLAAAPWSGSYWPHYKGILARRYLDPEFPDSQDYSVNSVYLRRTLGAVDPRLFSPAEKYDALVGDTDFTLTHTVLDWAARWANEREAAGSPLEPWMGICFGWAGASLRVPRPQRSVSVLAADGRTRIEFLPSDIKALATLLWDQAPVPRRWAGGICREENPRKDATGRPIAKECQDTNPATWHLAIVNQLGASRRSLIADIKSDHRIFNQPIVGYSFRYFEPRTDQDVEDIDGARVELRDYPEDPYAAWRSPKSVALVGIEMSFLYVDEAYPSPSSTDEPARDSVQAEVYSYDLELDETGRIVGGEWRSMDRPDYLWVPSEGTRVSSVGDSYLQTPSWSGEASLPSDWAETARWTSSYAQPLAAIVESLVAMSK